MADLSTSYLGIPLKNPLVVASSPLSKKLSTVQSLEQSGAAAIVMYSLFEEQITQESLTLDYYLNRGTETYAEALSYFPDLPSYNIGPKAYVDHIRAVRKHVGIPVIGSLNGISSGGWVEYSQRIADAGADALELNLYYLPIDTHLSGATLEDSYVQLVKEVRAKVQIPLAVKLSPFFTSLPHVARRFVEEGANGLVLFNRFYQPELDIEALKVVPNLTLSDSDELRLPLRWIAILYGRVAADFAATGGVHTAADVVKAMMAGASVTQLASALIANGPTYLAKLLADLHGWLESHEYESIAQMKGSMSQRNVAEPAAFERANYLKVLNSLEQRAGR